MSTRYHGYIFRVTMTVLSPHYHGCGFSVLLWMLTLRVTVVVGCSRDRDCPFSALPWLSPMALRVAVAVPDGIRRYRGCPRWHSALPWLSLLSVTVTVLFRVTVAVGCPRYHGPSGRQLE